jgi:thiosulfate reductase cytochrome b subunit
MVVFAVMSQVAPMPPLVLDTSTVVDRPRHSAVVRVTHWLTVVNVVVLLLSGIVILLAHPRLYWGETGGVGGPSLIDLPLPFVLEVPIRGPGRYLHFLFAWTSLFTALVYIAAAVASGHLTANLLPARRDLTVRAIRNVIENHLRFRQPGESDLATYNVLQRLSYTAVVFVLAPLIMWTGLAMSPAVTSVFPFTVTVFGGHQSARTIHFFAACALVLFFVVHVALVCQSGFRARMRAMVTGQRAGKELS